MLVDAPLPHGSGANLAVVGTLFEGFGRLVTSPPLPRVGCARWDARSDRFLLARQSFQQLFSSQSTLYAGSVCLPMTADTRAAVLTARRAAQHFRLSVPHDAYEYWCILTLLPEPRPVSA
jgi:hypothetical protein